MDSVISDKNKKLIKYYILRYLQEIMEGFIAYSIFMYFKNKRQDINIIENFKAALIIGFITLILEEYNPVYNKAMKSGLIMSAISSSFK